jgi:glycosyltransferase involved in cell wall biosynthesis
VLGYTAAFLDWKRHTDALKAFSELAPANPSLQLVLISDGPLREGIERQATQMKLHVRVHFIGIVPSAQSLLPMLDVYIHPADGEGFGLAVVEAMAASLPILAARSPRPGPSGSP